MLPVRGLPEGHRAGSVPTTTACIRRAPSAASRASAAPSSRRPSPCSAVSPDRRPGGRWHRANRPSPRSPNPRPPRRPRPGSGRRGRDRAAPAVRRRSRSKWARPSPARSRAPADVAGGRHPHLGMHRVMLGSAVSCAVGPSTRRPGTPRHRRVAVHAQLPGKEPPCRLEQPAPGVVLHEDHPAERAEQPDQLLGIERHVPRAARVLGLVEGDAGGNLESLGASRPGRSPPADSSALGSARPASTLRPSPPSRRRRQQSPGLGDERRVGVETRPDRPEDAAGDEHAPHLVQRRGRDRPSATTRTRSPRRRWRRAAASTPTPLHRPHAGNRIGEDGPHPCRPAPPRRPRRPGRRGDGTGLRSPHRDPRPCAPLRAGSTRPPPSGGPGRYRS